MSAFQTLFISILSRLDLVTVAVLKRRGISRKSASATIDTFDDEIYLNGTTSLNTMISNVLYQMLFALVQMLAT